MQRLIDHTYIFLTIVFTIYSQVVMRWQVKASGDLPVDTIEKIIFIAKLFINPWIISAVAATFLSGISWMLTMSKFDLNYAYPWISLNLIFMLFIGYFLFNEPINVIKITGTIFVFIGLIIITRG